MSTQRKYIRDGRAPISKKEATSRIMSSNKAKNTKPELILRKALYQANIRGYRLHWEKAPGRPDIAFPGKKVAIFVNGCFWHRCPHCQPSKPKTNTTFWGNKFQKNIERDAKKVDLLKEDKWQVMVIWECHITSNLDSCVESIKRLIEGHG